MTAVTGKVWIVAASRFADSPQQGWRELRDDCSEAMDAVKAGVHATRELEWIRGALQGEELGHGALWACGQTRSRSSGVRGASYSRRTRAPTRVRRWSLTDGRNRFWSSRRSA